MKCFLKVYQKPEVCGAPSKKAVRHLLHPLRRCQQNQDEVRMKICDKWRKKLAAFWKHIVDLISDNKRFPIPTSRQKGDLCRRK